MAFTDQSSKQERPETLIAIQQAYNAVWSILYGNLAPTQTKRRS